MSVVMKFFLNPSIKEITMKIIFTLLALAALAGTAVAASQQDAGAAKPTAASPHAAMPAGHMPITAASVTIQLTRKGKVLEVIDSPMYTYVHVTGDKSQIWLAAYKTDIAKDDIVNYSDGVAMSNFYSKSLNRTFDTIVFVDQVVPEKK